MMSILDDLLVRLLRGPVQRLLAEEQKRFTYGESEDPLYRDRVHGRLERLHIDPTAIVNNALFNVSGGDITIGEYAFFGHEVAVLTGTHDITKFGASTTDRLSAIRPRCGDRGGRVGGQPLDGARPDTYRQACGRRRRLFGAG